MFRKFINPILILPLCLYINSHKVLSRESIDNIEEIIQEKEDQIFLDYSEINKIIYQNNQELKSLE